MKKLLFILLAVVLLTSCDVTIPIPVVKNPKEATTLEILEKANSDTLCYKVAIVDNVLYVVHDDLVQMKVASREPSGFWIWVTIASCLVLITFIGLLINL